MQVFLVFSADAHHTNDSKRFISAYSTLRFAIEAIKAFLKSDFTKEDERMLDLYRQTHGREENWMIDVETLDQQLGY